MKKSILRFATFSVLLLILSLQFLNAQTALEPSGGGTSDNPYLIANLENLYWVSQQVNGGDLAGAHFEQTANIDASETSGWFAGEGWVPVGNSSHGFSGIYHGGGFVVDGLTINRSGSDHIGLFGIVASGAEIRRLGVTGVDLTGGDFVGGLVGSLEGSLFGCYATGVVSGTNMVGGLAGLAGSQGSGTSIDNTYSAVWVSGVSYVGGLAGLNHGAVSRSYATGAVSGGSGVGGLVGENQGTATDTYWNTETTGQESSDGGTGLLTIDMQRQASFAGFLFGDGSDWLMTPLMNDGYPVLSWQHGAEQYAIQPPYIGDAYQVSTLRDLYWISQNPARWTAAYQQTNNINATETATWCGGSGWVVVGEYLPDHFSGSYDGQGHSILGLHVNRPGTLYTGLFGYSEEATFSNLGLVDVNIIGRYSGALMGGSFFTNVHNCHSSGFLHGEGSYAGGLVGYMFFGSMSESFSEVIVVGNANAGGLAGAVQNSDIEGCYSTGSVSGGEGLAIKYVGGFVGYFYGGGTMKNSFSTGQVSSGNTLGGFVAMLDGVNSQIKDCYSTGDVAGDSKGGQREFGGFCGENLLGNIESSYSTGSVTCIGGVDYSTKGFVAFDLGGTYAGNFFDHETSNQSTAIGAAAKTAAEMTRAGTFVSEGWEFREGEQAWGFNGVDNGGYPFLRHQGYQPKDLWLGLTSGSWETTGNWSENAIPTQTVIIPQIHENNHTAVIGASAEAPAQCESLTIEANAHLAIAPGGALSVTGTFVNEAGTEGFTIQSDATGTGSLIHGNPNVSATVERHIMAADWTNGKDGWHFFSSPVINIPIVGSAFVPDPQSAEWGTPGNRTFDLYAFDESAEAQGEVPALPWINIRNAEGGLNASFETNFIHGKGYLTASQTTEVKAFQGELNQGNVQIQLSSTAGSENHGWNLLGNPYPSAIRWHNSYSNQFVQHAVAIYDTNRPGGAGYVYIKEDDYIPAHQGFFAEVNPEAGGQNFTFTNAMRAHGSDFMKDNTAAKAPTRGNAITSGLKAGHTASAETGALGEITIRLIKDEFFDETRLMLHPASTKARDRHDAAKLFSFHPDMPQLYSLTADQVHLAINAIPEIAAETAIPLGFTVPEAGSYTIELGEASGAFMAHDIYLLDHQKNTQTRLSAGGQYVFAADPSDENHETNRFKILFSLSDATATSDPSAPNMHIYSSGQTIYVAFSQPEPGCTVEVYDLSGRLLMRKAANGSARFSTRLDVETGIYVVRVSGGESVQVDKVFIQ